MSTYRSASAGSSSGPAPSGVSLGHLELSAADHWIVSLSPRPVLACTHLVQEPYRHVAISLVADGTFPTSAELAPAAAAALSGKFGRAVVFPGADRLVGTLTVAEILAISAIDRVEILGSGEADPSALVDTRDFVRPQYRSGSLVLTTTPAAGDLLVPFETRDPTPCCADH